MSQDNNKTKSGQTDSGQDSPQQVAPKKTVAELEQSIEMRRRELEETLEALTYQAQPKVQLEILAAEAKGRFQSLLDEVSGTFTAALQGDRRAIINVLGATGAGVLLTTLVIARGKRRRHEAQEIKRWRRFARDLGQQDPPHNIEVIVR